jgi:hypothetical protein
MTRPIATRSLGICLALAIGGVATVALTGAPAQAQGPAPQGPVLAAETDLFVATEQAGVVGVDAATRMVTLRLANGKTMSVKLGPEVRNFDQIKAGDQVVAVLEHAVTYAVLKAGTKQPGVVVAGNVERTKKGAKPGAEATRQVALTMLIVGVNATANTLDVVPQGGGPIQTLTVRNKERQAYLKQIQPGQLLSVVITDSIAVVVRPAGT